MAKELYVMTAHLDGETEQENRARFKIACEDAVEGGRKIEQIVSVGELAFFLVSKEQ